LCGLDNSDLFALVAKPVIATAEFSEDDEVRYRLLEPIVQRLLNSEVIQTLSQSGQLLATRLADVLRAATNARERKALRPWLESVWLSLGGARAYEGFVAGDNPWQEAGAFFTLLENKLPHLSDFDQTVFEESISKLFVTPQVNNDLATVQLMTMHKAKGLEFDSVILPYLDRTTKSDDKPLLMWDSYHSHESNAPQLLLAIKPSRGGEADKVYDYLHYKRAQRSALEQVRLLYVATTRAKANLYLSYGGKTNDKGERLPPASTSLLAKLRPAFEAGELAESWNESWNQQSLPVLNISAVAVDRNEKSVNTLLQLQPDWRGCSADIQLTIGEAPDWQENISAKAVGNVVHKTLEIIASHSIAFWEDLNDQDQRNWLSRLLEQELPNGLIADALDNIQKQLRAVLTDKTGRWILDIHHQQSKVELSLFFKSGIDNPNRDSMKQEVIDRCFIADGVCWLIDYKTSELLSDQSLEDFLQGEQLKYQQKMHSYAKLLAVYYQLPVRAALYFTAIAHFYELNLSV
jgi:ATP-dependent helicase/nuclease subunit A